ncbi:TRAP transporter small permease [Tessaracoccus sp. Z1128]
MTAVKKGIDRLLAVLVALLFAVLTLVVVWQVFARQVLKSAPAWTGEAANYLFVWTSLIGIAFVFGERGHMAVTFVAERVPKPVRYVTAVVIQLIIIGFAVLVLILGGWESAMNAWLQNSVSLPVNIGWMYLMMPVAGLFIVFYALNHILEDLRGEGPLTVEDPTAALEPKLPVIADETVITLLEESPEDTTTKLDELEEESAHPEAHRADEGDQEGDR